MRSDLLHVIVAYFNPLRWSSRINLYHDFRDHMLDCGVNLIVVESALGERPFEAKFLRDGTEDKYITHIPVRSKTLIWCKENLLNIGMSRLPPDWKYMCWADCDIKFRKTDWASETVHALQQYDIVQPWDTAIDLGPNDEIMYIWKSFAHQWWHNQSVARGVKPDGIAVQTNGKPLPHLAQNNFNNEQGQPGQPGTAGEPGFPGKPPYGGNGGAGGYGGNGGAGGNCNNLTLPSTAEKLDSSYKTLKPWWKLEGGMWEYPHSGYAWAATRQSMIGLGGLMEFAALGAADHHQALSIVGLSNESLTGLESDSYKKHVSTWEDRAIQHINYNMGYVAGGIEHGWHGNKSQRQYQTRWKIITQHGFDPDVDIKKNEFGVVELSCNKPKLRHQIDMYLRERHEDANIILD